MKVKRMHSKEEVLNTVSHLAGVIFGITGIFLLLSKNSEKTSYATTSLIAYSITFVSMFVCSSLYHYVRNPRLKRNLRIADHINIYFLIAGTYTPICLITLIDGKGWIILYSVLVLALFGSLLKLFLTGKFEFLSLALYLAMGWLIVYDFDHLYNHIDFRAIQLLFLGGAFYTFGIVFYAIERIPYNHFIWHIFVLAGAISHWLMIYKYVI